MEQNAKKFSEFDKMLAIYDRRVKTRGTFPTGTRWVALDFRNNDQAHKFMQKYETEFFCTKNHLRVTAVDSK